MTINEKAANNFKLKASKWSGQSKFRAFVSQVMKYLWHLTSFDQISVCSSLGAKHV